MQRHPPRFRRRARNEPIDGRGTIGVWRRIPFRRRALVRVTLHQLVIRVSWVRFAGRHDEDCRGYLRKVGAARLDVWEAVTGTRAHVVETSRYNRTGSWLLGDAAKLGAIEHLTVPAIMAHLEAVVDSLSEHYPKGAWKNGGIA